MHPLTSQSPVLQPPARVVPAELLTALREQLSQHPQIRFALLFGSLARGEARPESDLDLAVSADVPLDAANLARLIEALAEATGRPVDLVDLACVGEPLLGQILTHGMRVLGSDAQHAALISRHVFNVADFVPYQRRIWAEQRQRWIGR